MKKKDKTELLLKSRPSKKRSDCLIRSFVFLALSVRVLFIILFYFKTNDDVYFSSII